MIEFPASPTVGQTYTYLSRSWFWKGDAWQILPNQGQATNLLYVIIAVQDPKEIDLGPDVYTLNYV